MRKLRASHEARLLAWQPVAKAFLDRFLRYLTSLAVAGLLRGSASTRTTSPFVSPIARARFAAHRSADRSIVRQEIIAIEEAPVRDSGEIIEDDGEAYQRIVAFLDELKVI